MNPFNQPYGGYGQATLASPSSHLCKFLKKPVIFVIGLFSVVAAILMVITGLVVSDNFSTTFFKLMNDMTAQEKVAVATMNSLMSTYIIVMISIIAALILLEAIPYLCMYFRSRSGKKPTGSVTVLQVVSIIQLVGACFLVLLIFPYILNIASPSSFSNAVYNVGMGNTILILSVEIVAAIGVALNLIYAINKIRLAFSAKAILQDRATKLKGAGYIGVINIITGVYQGIVSIFSIISLIVGTSIQKKILGFESNAEIQSVINDTTGYIYATQILSCISAVIFFVIMISKAVAAFGAKRHMNSFIESYPQSPTDYYNDGYSNYDNNSFNPYQYGYTNTNTNTNSTTNANPYAGNPFGGNDTNYGNPYTSQNGYNGGQNGGNY
ncbi:MAG: hypothetical protein ACI4F2_09315 [Acutalibacteraceae bacterium]